VKTAKIGNLLLRLGNSFIMSLITLCTPSYIMAYTRSSSLLSRMILKSKRLVDSSFEILPLFNRLTSFLIKKCLLAYIMTSVKTPGALSFSIKVEFRIEIHSRRIGKVFLKARNSRSIFENYILNSLKS
jgi:hypothetical protein